MTNAFDIVQDSFAGALLDADRPVPGTVTSYTARHPQKRFAVYRNNVIVGLISALRAQFPACENIVGKEFFAVMARLYIETQPPRSPILVTYGDGFPDFIAGFMAGLEPAAEIDYLADVARLEAARTRAYHAADAIPLDPARWHEIDPQALAGTRVTLHPSVEILRSPHPVVAIWAMNAGEAKLTSIEDWPGEDAVVARPQLGVTVRKLPAGGAAFLAALAEGTTLGQAALTATDDHADFDLAANLAGLISAGLATGLSSTPIEKDSSR